MKRYSIVLADDHPFLLEGLVTILGDMPELEIKATLRDGLELMEMVETARPDMILLDLNMPGYDGLQCLQKIKLGHPSIKVLVLTSYTQPELVSEIKRLGADGFFKKDSSSAELKEAIRQVLAGATYFPSFAQSADKPDSPFFADGFLKKFSLTKREVDIIRLVCQEMSTKEMASALFLSELTINTHRRNILRKLELKNVAGLVNFAQENRLI